MLDHLEGSETRKSTNGLCACEYLSAGAGVWGLAVYRKSLRRWPQDGTDVLASGGHRSLASLVQTRIARSEHIVTCGAVVPQRPTMARS